MDLKTPGNSSVAVRIRSTVLVPNVPYVKEHLEKRREEGSLSEGSSNQETLDEKQYSSSFECPSTRGTFKFVVAQWILPASSHVSSCPTPRIPITKNGNELTAIIVGVCNELAACSGEERELNIEDKEICCLLSSLQDLLRYH